MVVFVDNFAGEAGAAADVEDEGGAGEVEEVEAAVGHRGLDVLDAGGGSVFLGFEVIVEEVRRTGGRVRKGVERGGEG